MKKNIIIKSISHDGKGIGYIDNKIIFVPKTIDGEVVNAKVIKDKKNYLEGKLVSVLKKSDKRTENLCPYYDKCGGCAYLHIDKNYEEEIKTNAVIDIFKKYSNLDISPKFISLNEYNYRNKIELKIKDNIWGFYDSASHDFIRIDNCLLAKESINNIIKDTDLFHIKNGTITIRTNYNDEILIKIDTENKYEIDIDNLKTKHNIIGIIVNEKIIYGTDSFIERIGGYLFEVNINSFFQINLDILNEVFKILKNYSFGNLVDLYCGVGTLGIACNKTELYGIEIIKEAVKDAIKNAKINKQNNYYLLGDSSKIKEINNKIDTIIVDPPRSGLNKETINNIININASKIVYMSCNPMTLARDINIIKDNYKIDDFYILNMFPKTKHIECLLLMSHK